MVQSNGRSFNEIQVGDTASFSVTVSREDHDNFTALSGDTSPVHTDDAFAAAHGFERSIGYAFHISALLSRLYGMYLPGGSSVCLKQESAFVAPWYPGDTIYVSAKVVRMFKSTRIVEIKSEIKRNGDITVFRGLGSVRMLL